MIKIVSTFTSKQIKKPMIDKVGLSEKEFANIAGKIKRRVELNGALMGKVKKVATSDQIVQLLAIEKEFGTSLPYCPAIKILRSIKC